MTALTAELLREILTYEPGSGIFRWNVTRGKNAKAGSAAGSINAKGYVIISVHGRGYRSHRLAWLYVYGEWPPNDIDHINLDKTDNRISNLRAATRAQNIWNTGLRKSNGSGAKGVWFDKIGGKWAAEIMIHRKKKWLGRFETIEEASLAYAAAAQEMHGEFSNLGDLR